MRARANCALPQCQYGRCSRLGAHTAAVSSAVDPYGTLRTDGHGVSVSGEGFAAVFAEIREENIS